MGPGSLRISCETMDKDNATVVLALEGEEEMRIVEGSNIMSRFTRNGVASHASSILVEKHWELTGAHFGLV